MEWEKIKVGLIGAAGGGSRIVGQVLELGGRSLC
jgi:predicted homoserine dehydrogenase-like protein